jgi:hypothetical protein
VSRPDLPISCRFCASIQFRDPAADQVLGLSVQLNLDPAGSSKVQKVVRSLLWFHIPDFRIVV